VRCLRTLRASTENQLSARLAHDALVGVKCRCRRARLRLGWASQSLTGLGLWANRLSHMMWTSMRAGGVQVDPLEEREHVGPGVALSGLVEQLAGCRVERGEQIEPSAPFAGVGESAVAPRDHGQRRLGAVYGLDPGSSRRTRTPRRPRAGPPLPTAWARQKQGSMTVQYDKGGSCFKTPFCIVELASWAFN